MSFIRTIPPLVLVGIIGGTVLLIFSFVWAFSSRVRRRRRTVRALSSVDPAVRLSAIEFAGQSGLSPFADALVKRALVEDVQTVINGLVDLIRRHQWEPGTDERVIYLRHWAQKIQESTTSDDNNEVDTSPKPKAVEIAAESEPETAEGSDLPRQSYFERPRLAQKLSVPQPTNGGIPSPSSNKESGGVLVDDAVDPPDAANSPPSTGFFHDRRAPGGHDRRAGDDKSVQFFRTPDGKSFTEFGAARSPTLLASSVVQPNSFETEFQRSVPKVAFNNGGSRATSYKVIVTGAGGPAGVAVMKALMASGHHVVAADASQMAVGLRLSYESGVLPRADEPGFVREVCLLALRTGASAIIPTIAEEVALLSLERENLLSVAGLASWLPQHESVITAIDKWRLANLAFGKGLSMPATALGNADGIEPPWVVKPRFGRGSRDVYFVDDPDSLGWALARVDQPIVQHRCDGEEFTVDVLAGPDGKLLGAVPRWRLETRGGISTLGETFLDNEVIKQVETLMMALPLEGCANVQGFIDDDGKVMLIEVNPRFSGGLPLSLAAGSDLVGEYLRGIVGFPIRPERLRFQPGVQMFRHFNEVFAG